MKIFKIFLSVLKSYDYKDKVLTIIGVAVFLLMIAKMMVFPYGLFGFGQTAVYTEGFVSRNGISILNPLFVDFNDVDREVSRLIFSGLMKYNPERKAVVEDMGVLSLNSDKDEYTFKIREGIKWHDGKPLTGEDVYFTFQEVIKNPSFPNEILRTNFDGVKIELVEPMTIKFKLDKPNVFFVTNLLVGILPKHILEKVDSADLYEHEFNKKPIGTGPYMITDSVERFSSGRTQVTLTKNPHYYGERPTIEFMRFIAYPTMEALLKEINSVNGVPRVSGKYILDFINNPRFELISYELPQYQAVFMNMDSEILKSDRRIRLALQKAISKEELIGESVDKIRLDTPLMELDQEEWLHKSDKEQAQEELKEAGYKFAKEDTERVGIRYNDEGIGLELKLIARLYDSETYQFEETTETVAFLKEAWEEIGFSIQIEFLPENQFKEKIQSRQYDLLLVGHIMGYNLDTYSYWHSTQANPLGQNFSNYRSFQVDSIIEDIRSIFDRDIKEEKLSQLAKRLTEDIPAIFLYRPLYYYATDSKVKGVSMDGVVFPSDRFGKINEWSF